MTLPDDDRRNFRRYQKQSDIVLKIDSHRYVCRTVDYSADGICLEFSGSVPSLTLGKTIELRLEDPDLVFMGKVVRKEKKDGVEIIGFQRIDNIKGTCYDFRLPDVLLGLQRTGKTGIFQVATGKKNVKIYFRNGDMIFANSNHDDDRFGEVLLKEGKISLQQYFDASESMKTKKGKRLGTILIELGYLKATELVWAVRHQVVEIIVNLLTAECGHFEFLEGELPSEEAITLNLSAADLIYRGVKRVTNFQYILQDFPPIDSVLTFSQDPLDLFQSLSLSEKDKEILSLISKGKSVRDILSSGVMNDFDALKTLYGLICARLVRVRGEEVVQAVSHEDIISEPLAEIDPEFNQMINEVYDSMKNKNYYEILGLPLIAPSEDIKKAFFRLTKEFHPDRHFMIQSEDIKKKLNGIFTHISEAYNTLSSKKNKIEYDMTLVKEGSKAPAHKELSEQERAEQAYNNGREKMLHGDYVKAEQLFAQAAYLDNKRAEYLYYQGLVLTRLNKFNEAARVLERAIHLDQKQTHFHVALGNAFYALGFSLRARSAFEKALMIEPTNESAMRGIEKLDEMR